MNIINLLVVGFSALSISVEAAQVITKVTKKSANIRIKSYSAEVPDEHGFFMKKSFTIPKDSQLTFDRDSMEKIIKPHYGDSLAGLKVSRGEYWGPVKIKTPAGKSYNKDFYIYKYDMDLAPFLRSKWDWPLPNGARKFVTEVEWDKVSTKGYWTWSSYYSLKNHGRDLIENTPEDIVDFCPNYFNLKNNLKRLVFVKILSSIAKRESAFDPEVTNDESKFSADLNVISRGLLQISFSSAQSNNYKRNGCQVSEALDLVDPGENLRCGVAIFNYLTKKDGCFSCKKNGKWKGAARYWSTLRTPYKLKCDSCASGYANIGKKSQIIEEIKNTRYCKIK
jgi:hypothetical protein